MSACSQMMSSDQLCMDNYNHDWVAEEIEITSENNNIPVTDDEVYLNSLVNHIYPTTTDFEDEAAENDFYSDIQQKGCTISCTPPPMNQSPYTNQYYSNVGPLYLPNGATNSPRFQPFAFRANTAQMEVKKENSHKCIICTFSCDDEDDSKKHLLAEHIGGPDNETYIEHCLDGDVYRCIFCKHKCYTVDDFNRHTMLHKASEAPTEPVKQNKPQKRRAPSQPAVGKSKSNGVHPRYSCQICSFSAHNAKALEKHYKSHINNAFVCPICNVSIPNHSEYLAHLNSHKDERLFSCNLCDYMGRTKSALNQHKQNHKAPKYSCKICPFKTVKQARIIRHERIHTGEKPFTCPHCDASFNQDGTLVIHKRMHTGERPYKCETCPFVTISGSSLRSHEKKHNAKRATFSCSICHQVFLSEGSLKVHNKKHLDEALQLEAVNGHSSSYQSVASNSRACKTRNHESPVKNPKQPALICRTCGKEFNRRRKLRLHEEEHEGAVGGFAAASINLGDYTFKSEWPDSEFLQHMKEE